MNRWLFIFIISLTQLPTTTYGIEKVDSLKQELKMNITDTSKVKVYVSIANHFKNNNLFDSAIYYYSKAKLHSTNYPRLQYKNLKNLGVLYYFEGDYDNSIIHFSALLEQAELNKDSSIISSALNGLGVVYMEAGASHKDRSMLDKALEFHKKAIRIKKAIKESEHSLAISYNNIANVHGLNDKPNKAILSYMESLKLYRKVNDSMSMASTMENLANVYDLNKEPEKAEKLYLQAIDLRKNVKDSIGQLKGINNIIEHYLSQNKHEGLKDQIIKSIEFTKRLGLKRDLMYSYLLMYRYFRKIDEFDSAFVYIDKHYSQKDSLFNEQNQKVIAELETKYETHKKEKALEVSKLEIEKKEALLHRKNTILYSGIAILIFLLILAIVLIHSIQIKKRTNKILEEKNNLVNKQKNEIDEQNQEIKSSIQYAKRIQQAILPSNEIVKDALPDSFVLYLPKDIVSGDFYWVEKKGALSLFSVVDCTGHGVPGAFMSMVGYNGLNKIVNEQNVSQPGIILDELHQFVYSSLHKQGENKLKDGMDLSFCSYNYETCTLEYAGANNSVYIISNNELNEIKATKQPVGSYKTNKKSSFTNHSIKLKSNDNVYLFSDGYADQFGGKNDKKFMSKNFKSLLIDIHKESSEKQKKILFEKFINWKGNNEQIDDICIIGFKIP